MLAYFKNEWPFLVISPASLVASWAEMIKSWLPSMSEDRIHAIFSSKDAPMLTKPGQAFVISYDIAAKLAKDIAQRKFRIIVADESHSLRNIGTKRTKSLKPVIKVTIGRPLGCFKTRD